MVTKCCIRNCKSRFVRGGPITLHRLPHDPTRKKAWMEKIGDLDVSMSKNAKICSRHFKDDCFDPNRFGGTWLKSDALPTEFECFIKNQGKSNVKITLSSMKNSLKTVTSASSNVSGLSTSICMEPSQSNSKGSNHLGDSPIIISSPIIFLVQSNYNTGGPSNSPAMMTENDSSLSNCDDGTRRVDKRFEMEEDVISLAMAKKALAVAKKKISTYKREMYKLRKQNSRMQRKVGKLEEIVAFLNSNHCISDSAASASKAA